MTRNEFIERAIKLGYCYKVDAEAYASDRTNFSEEDFELAYRFSERRQYLKDIGEQKLSGYAHASRPLGNGCRTTKRYTVYNGHEG